MPDSASLRAAIAALPLAALLSIPPPASAESFTIAEAVPFAFAEASGTFLPVILEETLGTPVCLESETRGCDFDFIAFRDLLSFRVALEPGSGALERLAVGTDLQSLQRGAYLPSEDPAAVIPTGVSTANSGRVFHFDQTFGASDVTPVLLTVHQLGALRPAFDDGIEADVYANNLTIVPTGFSRSFVPLQLVPEPGASARAGAVLAALALATTALRRAPARAGTGPRSRR